MPPLPKIREIPGIGPVEFPPDTPDALIEKKIAAAKRAQATQTAVARTEGPGLGEQFMEGAGRGFGSIVFGTPEAPLPGGLNYPGAAERTSQAYQTALRMAPPTIAAAAGGGNPLLSGLYGAAAEGGMQATGLTPYNPEQIALQAAAPPAFGAMASPINTAAKFIGRHAPGAAGALHDMAGATIRTLGGLFKPGTSADDLYAIVGRFNPQIKMDSLRTAAKTLIGQEKEAAAGLKIPAPTSTAKSLRKMTRGTVTERPVVGAYGEDLGMVREIADQGMMPFDRLRIQLKRLGGKIRETRAAGGEEHGAYKYMYREALNDLERAASQADLPAEAMQALKQANKAARMEFAADEISDILTEAKGGITTVQSAGTTLQRVNFGKILTNLRGNAGDDIRKSLSPTQWADLIGTIEGLAKTTPAPPPATGVNAGSMLRSSAIATGSGLGALGGMAFGNVTAGTAIGAIVGAQAPQIIGRALMTDTGRAILRNVLRDGIVTPAKLQLLGAMVASSPVGRAVEPTLVNIGRSLGEGMKQNWMPQEGTR